MDAKMVPQSPPDSRRSVMAATMQTCDSGRTSWRAALIDLSPRKSMIWAVFMLSLEATLSPVKFRRTLPSPMMVKSRLIDIKSLQKGWLKTWNNAKECLFSIWSTCANVMIECYVSRWNEPGLEPDLGLRITSSEPTSGQKTNYWSQQWAR